MVKDSPVLYSSDLFFIALATVSVGNNKTAHNIKNSGVLVQLGPNLVAIVVHTYSVHVWWQINTNTLVHLVPAVPPNKPALTAHVIITNRNGGQATTTTKKNIRPRLQQGEKSSVIECFLLLLFCPSPLYHSLVGWIKYSLVSKLTVSVWNKRSIIFWQCRGSDSCLRSVSVKGH